MYLRIKSHSVQLIFLRVRLSIPGFEKPPVGKFFVVTCFSATVERAFMCYETWLVRTDLSVKLLTGEVCIL
jgi:hypothetical protein